MTPFQIIGEAEIRNNSWRVHGLGMSIQVNGTLKNALWVRDSLNRTYSIEEEALERGG